MRVRYGTQATCRHCGQDIEYVGKWWDRGGNTDCPPYHDRESGALVDPQGRLKHAPYHEKN